MKAKANAALGSILSGAKSLPHVENNNISWDHQDLERVSFEIIFNIEFPRGIEDHIKDHAVWHALNACARKNDFEVTFFLKQLNDFVRRHMSARTRSYVGACQINSRGTAALPRRLATPFGAVHVRARLDKDDRAILDSWPESDRRNLGLQDDFEYLVCEVDARDDQAALDIARQRITYSLGVINLVYAGFGVSDRFGVPGTPIGKFMPASSTFVIDRSGRRMGSVCSESHYPIRWKSHFSVWEKLDSRFIVAQSKRYAKRLADVDFRDEVIRAILSFQAGLEATAIDLALLKFWSGIEILCSRWHRPGAIPRCSM